MKESQNQMSSRSVCPFILLLMMLHVLVLTRTAQANSFNPISDISQKIDEIQTLSTEIYNSKDILNRARLSKLEAKINYLDDLVLKNQSILKRLNTYKEALQETTQLRADLQQVQANVNNSRKTLKTTDKLPAQRALAQKELTKAFSHMRNISEHASDDYKKLESLNNIIGKWSAKK